MRLRLVSLAAATSIALPACTANTKLVTHLASESTGCDPAVMEVTPLEDSYAGIKRVQTQGCGTTYNSCPTWQTYVMATLGFYVSSSNVIVTPPDPLHCSREKR